MLDGVRSIDHRRAWFLGVTVSLTPGCAADEFAYDTREEWEAAARSMAWPIPRALGGIAEQAHPSAEPHITERGAIEALAPVSQRSGRARLVGREGHLGGDGEAAPEAQLEQRVHGEAMAHHHLMSKQLLAAPALTRVMSRLRYAYRVRYASTTAVGRRPRDLQVGVLLEGVTVLARVPPTPPRSTTR